MTDPASQHPYMYCRGNPINYADPSGYDIEFKKDPIGWWMYESHLWGPYGRPVSEWGSAKSTKGNIRNEARRHGRASLLFYDASIYTAVFCLVSACTGNIQAGAASAEAVGISNSLEEKNKGRRWNWTRHAEERRGQKGFTHEKVEEALNSNKKSYPGNKPGTRYIKYNKKRIVYDPKTGNIITIRDD